MEKFSFCAGNSRVTGEFPTQRPVTRSFDVFFDLRLNKLLIKQCWGWWFETPSHPLWRYCNGYRRHAMKKVNTQGFSQSSTWRFALDFTSHYRISPNHTRLTGMPKFYMSTFGNRRNNSKTTFICLYFVRLPKVRISSATFIPTKLTAPW